MKALIGNFDARVDAKRRVAVASGVREQICAGDGVNFVVVPDPDPRVEPAFDAAPAEPTATSVRAAPATPSMSPSGDVRMIEDSPQPESPPPAISEMDRLLMIELFPEPPDPPGMAENLPVPQLDNDPDLCGAMVLEMKPRPGVVGTKGRELDPRKFDKKEWEMFQKSDAKNWQQHLDFGAVRVVMPGAALEVSKERVFTIPCRFVRTMKNDEANSGLVIPGHMDLDKATLGRAKAKDGG